MSNFVEQASIFTPQTSLAWLSEFQQRQANLWREQSLPTRKTEDWKYTNLKPLDEAGVFDGQPEVQVCTEGLLDKVAIPGLDSIDLVFVNGVFQSQYSTSLGGVAINGLTITRFADADDKQQALIRAQLGSVANVEKHLFATLNSSLLDEGVLVHVAQNAIVKRPIRVVWVSGAQEKAFMVSQRLLVVAEQSSEFTVIEHFVSDEASQNSFTNSVTEIDVRENAKVGHYRLHQEQEDLMHVGGIHVKLAKNAVWDSFQLALGGKLKRIDIVVNHRGEGAHCELNGIYLPRNSQHVDFHTCIEHEVPHCTTNEVFRGIIGDSARAVFNGRIHIHKDAQKTLAQLSNKNLLTSKKAEIDTKPELEIYADDVQCAHGATVAQLDEGAMHYLQTRGVSEEEAKVMLSFGFINELINQVKLDAIGEYLRPQLAELFARDPELLRHIA